MRRLAAIASAGDFPGQAADSLSLPRSFSSLLRPRIAPTVRILFRISRVLYPENGKPDALSRPQSPFFAVAILAAHRGVGLREYPPAGCVRFPHVVRRGAAIFASAAARPGGRVFARGRGSAARRHPRHGRPGACETVSAGPGRCRPEENSPFPRAHRRASSARLARGLSRSRCAHVYRPPPRRASA